MMQIKTEKQAMLRDLVQALSLGCLVFLSRYFTRGTVYYVDGPTLVRSIQSHMYIIQPPGYWLYDRIGGLFPDGAFGLQFMNQIFSAAGASVFFLLCRRMKLNEAMSWAASLCYSSIFFVWLAGDVHSSYASQILFPPLLVYLFLAYQDKKTIVRLSACGVCFALGAGFRPSDGVFLAPLFALLALRFVQGWKRQCLLIVITGTACLGWYVPQEMALRAWHMVPMGAYLNQQMSVSVLLSGVTPRTIANVVRVILPFVVGFGFLIPTFFFQRSRFENILLAIWITPGMFFYLFIYMADPVYFIYLTAAVILAAALARQQRQALVLLVFCAVFNASLFLFARPLRGDSHIDQAINFYIVKYSFYGIQHQWMSTIGGGGPIP